ncbi:hypothetical protein FGO68_gene3633 [Halteria grandinella]|uniref:Uncharacterized protein n=1 Tax=Halteria grandinella TaxID=5974 RepID=A0A8J8NQK1_HALGN|nr:hypothetical protein FGO68_gene3633 [Halteria grandinella]
MQVKQWAIIQQMRENIEELIKCKSDNDNHLYASLPVSQVQYKNLKLKNSNSIIGGNLLRFRLWKSQQQGIPTFQILQIGLIIYLTQSISVQNLYQIKSIDQLKKHQTLDKQRMLQSSEKSMWNYQSRNLYMMKIQINFILPQLLLLKNALQWTMEPSSHSSFSSNSFTNQIQAQIQNSCL